MLSLFECSLSGEKDLPLQTVTAEGDFCKVFQEEISISWAWRNRATIWLRNIKICCCSGKKVFVGILIFQKWDEEIKQIALLALEIQHSYKSLSNNYFFHQKSLKEFSLHLHKILSVDVQLVCICAKTDPADIFFFFPILCIKPDRGSSSAVLETVTALCVCNSWYWWYLVQRYLVQIPCTKFFICWK